MIALPVFAYVFAKLCPDASDEVLKEISNSDMVKELSIIQGPYDVLIKVKGRTAKELNTFVDYLNSTHVFEEIAKYSTVRTMKKKRTAKRIEMKNLPLTERISSFNEVLRGYTKEEAIEEAKRCLRCKTPLCEWECPIDMNIATYQKNLDAYGYVGLITDERFDEAYRLMLDKCALPATVGRVCHHPCEDHCISGKKGDPIAICRLKRFVADYMYEQEKQLKANTRQIFKGTIKVKEKKDQRVAIIGSGPAGLKVAYDLARLGYNTTIFEEQAVLGGMLAWEIPAYRLPKDILQKEIDNILSLGIEVRTNTRIENIDELFAQGYDAIFIGVGAPKPRKLGIPGEDLEGVYLGEEFLKDVNLEKELDFTGKKVVVVGGGNTAIDSARTSLRLNAESVIIVYRRSRLQMPGHIHELREAEKEGVLFYFLASPVCIIGENKLEMVEFIRMKLIEADESGRSRPIPIEHSEFLIETDVCIPAVGRTPAIGWLNGIKLSGWDTIAVDDYGATSREGVFAGGDVVNGPSVVVEALASGRRAARGIHRYLQQKS